MKRILLFIGLKIVEIVPLATLCILAGFCIARESEKLGFWAVVAVTIICGIYLVWAFCFVKVWKWIPELFKANWKWAGKILERIER